MNLWCSLALFLAVLSLAASQSPHKRFEYKYSFKGPYLAQKDNQVPFWQYSGNAIASEESVRITPSLRSQKGQIWTKNPTNFEWWEVEFVFRVTGRGRIGADGLAIWFTDKPGVEGPVFGSSDKWNGLGVFFDSFDNDNKRNNPYIMAMVNDGTKIYDHEHDGLSQQLGGCLRDFRNKPFPVRAKLEYYKNVLTVRTQNIEYDYTKMKEEGEEEDLNQEASQTTTTPPPQQQTQAGSTTGTETTSSEFTNDILEFGHVMLEAAHDVAQEEPTGGWGWFSSEPTHAPKPSQDAPDATEGKKKRKRSKKQRKDRRRGGKTKKSKKNKRKVKVTPLMIHSGMTNNDKDYEICMRAENVFLPASGHFGVTAATGGLADDHDVLKFLVSSLRSPEDMAALQINQEEEERFRKEFQEYQEKTKRARDEYIAQNPDAERKEEEYESWEQRELKQIFLGQSQIHEVVRQLHMKMDEIIGRQERTLGLVSAVHSGMGGGQVATSGQVPPPPPPVAGGMPGDTIRRHEVDSIINNQRDIVQTARDIKNFVSEIHQKSNQLLSQGQKPQGSAQPVGYDLHVTLNEMKEGLNIVKRDVGATIQRISSGGGAGGCPNISCVSTTLFITFMVLQVVLLIGYIMYRDSKEAQAKKFY